MRLQKYNLHDSISVAQIGEERFTPAYLLLYETGKSKETIQTQQQHARLIFSPWKGGCQATYLSRTLSWWLHFLWNLPTKTESSIGSLVRTFSMLDYGNF